MDLAEIYLRIKFKFNYKVDQLENLLYKIFILL